ncbi:Zinc-regulated transporter 2 [Yarrowia sp. C11]|nr:Zinc-regulated transporter 2 [Yarrowia sp. C11]
MKYSHITVALLAAAATAATVRVDSHNAVALDIVKRHGDHSVAEEDEDEEDEDDHAGHDHSHDDHDHEGHDHAEEQTAEEAAAAKAAAKAAKLEEKCNTTPARDLNIKYRIGALFAMMGMSALGVLPPVLMNTFFSVSIKSIPMTFLKQFGTGVVISTAIIHLMFGAVLQFMDNPCLGELAYEPIGPAFVLAGLFLAFVIEYTFTKLLEKRSDHLTAPHSHGHSHSDSNSDLEKSSPEVTESPLHITPSAAAAAPGTTHTHGDGNTHGHNHSGEVSGGHGGHCLIDPTDKVSVMIMEAGIIFHSILIGVTLVLAPNSNFTTLFIAILFHQMFEGVGLGSRIAGLINAKLLTKLLMCFFFVLITPIGMAIGLGVIDVYNGSGSRTTIWVLGVLNGLSAGVLLWAGVVEMLAFDWLFGDLVHTTKRRTAVAFAGLVAGLILMSLIGKWA